MTIKFEELQTKVSFNGDILILPFSPHQKACDGVAWLLLQERSPGEVGREPTDQEVDPEICLGEQPGVLLAAKDYRSLDVLIEALIGLRDDLKDMEIMESLTNWRNLKPSTRDY
jgi:hypothetical protein